MDKKKLLWIGDAGCPSGFSRASHEILETVRHEFDVTVLGLNYRGDPHNYPYPIYAAAVEGDFFGVERIVWMCDLVQPDVIVIQNDGWNIQAYLSRLRRENADGSFMFPEHASIPVVAIVAVDGKNFRGRWLDGVAHAIFWTQFALNEARLGGYTGSASVIPLGVDILTYYPVEKEIARKKLPEVLADAFIVGNVNRNQPRKRWDLTVEYFARWIKDYEVKNAYLYLHTAPTGDKGVDIHQLAHYYGVLDRLILATPPIWYGDTDAQLRDTYNCFDVQISTTQGEGFGLTTFEGMACGVPQIVPAWSALGELTKDAVWQVPCTSTAIGPPYINIIGGVPDRDAFVRALHALYSNADYREQNSRAGLERVEEPQYRWVAVGRSFADAIIGELESKPGKQKPRKLEAVS